MVDVPLMAALLAALRGLPAGTGGDPDQLPSVGPGNLFGDLIRSGTVPTVRLTQIFRQAAQSAIVRNAHLVNAGELPDLRKNDNDFFSSSRRDPSERGGDHRGPVPPAPAGTDGDPGGPDPGALPHPAGGGAPPP